ncbi:MAG: helix-turn-helix domain-containing protein [Planctomycetota bacterium]|nr:helix-turn-helix domain-containing protein [Planctomycetota bacterium]
MTKRQPRPDDVISLPQAAHLLGVGPTTLKRWSDQGRIPHARTAGGHRRFLRRVVMDFRTAVDPRAPSTPTPLGVRLGEPAEWVDRANGLADADRMEAAIVALRTTYLGWGAMSDTIVNEFVRGLRVRQREGRLSEGAWRALVRSLVRSVQRVSGRLRPRVGAPVALIASPGGVLGPVLVALAEAVMREAGFTVLELGLIAEPGVLEEVMAEQRPHLVVLMADAEATAGELVTRLSGVGRAAAVRGIELWLAGGATWPMVDGARRVASFDALGQYAAARLGAEMDRRIHPAVS